MSEVSIVPCGTYEKNAVRAAVEAAVAAVGGIDFVTEGMTVVLKANLVSIATPDKAVTTHPEVLTALTEMLRARGARVIIGDSPGGLYNTAFVNRIYHAAGLSECVEAGAELNDDFSIGDADFPEGKEARRFTYTTYLDKADVIIDVCKFKTHGMMGYSGAAKNLFGTVPGTVKPEYHFRFPSYPQFADMIVDLNEYFKPRLAICDAVVGMEGNGPTAGTPRAIGAILASISPHKLDLLATSLIGLGKDEVPTLDAAYRRGLIPATWEELDVFGDPLPFHISDYETVSVRHSLGFTGTSDNVIKNIFGGIAAKALTSRPQLKPSECVGCNKCGQICPAKAIRIEHGKAVIDRKLCIRCFCCQEFCPKGAMKVHRPWIARILVHHK